MVTLKTMRKTALAFVNIRPKVSVILLIKMHNSDLGNFRLLFVH